MHDPILEILDRSLVAALALLVLTFCVYLAGSFLASRWTNRNTMQGLERRFESDHPNALPDPEMRNVWQAYLPRWDGLRAGRYGLLWSVGIGCLAFLFLCFSPWPTMKNFATLSNQPPLRVTFLLVDPTDKGFRFEGDVWNQSDDRVPVRASITLLDPAGAHVGGATALVAPQELAPRDKGQFIILLNPPAQATDFTLRFVGSDDEELAYAQGFPNTLETAATKPVPHRGRTALSALSKAISRGTR